MAIKFSREPIEDWVERYRNDDAPDNDRQKWSDQDQRPVSQKSKAKYSNYQKHKFFVRCTELDRSIIVVHCFGPLCFSTSLIRPNHRAHFSVRRRRTSRTPQVFESAPS